MTTPIPLVLTLWALGHSASQVAEMVGLPNRKHVERVVKQARRINEPRAVVHASVNHKPTGNARKVKAMLAAMPALEVVPLISRKKVKVPWVRTRCRSGKHAWINDNIYTSGRGIRSCRACCNERARAYRKAAK